MRRMSGRAGGVLGLWALGLMALAGGIAAGVPTAGAQGASSCTTLPDKVAAPAEIPLGARVRVTLTLKADCPPEAAPVDVVLVLDTSASMGDDEKLPNAQAAALAFIEAMDLDQSRVGLVLFNQDAGVRTPLTHSAQQIRAGVSGLIAGGKTNISGAVDVARAELLRDPVGHALAMVVLTDGFNTVAGADPVPVAAARAKDAGIKVATFCAGGQCDPGLEAAASDPALYYNVADPSQLAALYRQLAGALQANAVATLVVRDEIPANMRYIAGSARPTPDEVGANYLVWRLNGLPGPAGLSYELQPLEPGLHPTNVVATGQITDRRGRTGEALFPVPRVRVLPPPCPPTPMEIYFLIDDSNCLLNAFLNEMPAREAIVQGIGKVLDMTNPARDRAAVIGFGDTARTYQALTHDRQLVLDAARAVSMQDSSARLDLALDETRRQMALDHKPEALVVTITVTDGPMNAPALPTEARAEAMRRSGVRHYVIGIGDLAQYGLLRAVAEPGGLRELDFGGDVIGAYQDLGGLATSIASLCPGATATPGGTGVQTATPPGGSATPGSATATPVSRPSRIFLPRLARPE